MLDAGGRRCCEFMQHGQPEAPSFTIKPHLKLAPTRLGLVSLESAILRPSLFLPSRHGGLGRNSVHHNICRRAEHTSHDFFNRRRRHQSCFLVIVHLTARVGGYRNAFPSDTTCQRPHECDETTVPAEIAGASDLRLWPAACRSAHVVSLETLSGCNKGGLD